MRIAKEIADHGGERRGKDDPKRVEPTQDDQQRHQHNGMDVHAVPHYPWRQQVALDLLDAEIDVAAERTIGDSNDRPEVLPQPCGPGVSVSPCIVVRVDAASIVA
jgi:hypothetical protein